MQVGQKVVLLKPGWDKCMWFYEDACPKEGDVVTITALHPAYLDTDCGPVCNPDITFGEYIKPTGVEAAVAAVKKAVAPKATGDAAYVEVMKGVTGGYSCTTGSDPEIFAVDGKGKLIPAWEYLGKQVAGADPHAFWDGFQAEFTTKSASCLALGMDSIQSGLQMVWDAARKVDKKAKLLPSAVIEVPQDMMKAASDEHADLGCDPSANAYGTLPIDIADPRTMPLRFAGFHMHFGQGAHGDLYYSTKVVGTKELHKRADDAVKGIDQVAGLISVAVLGYMDDERRRQFYGRAGEYRLPPHGLEYRTLSVAALRHPVLAHLFFDLGRLGINVGLMKLNIWGVPQEEIQRIINERDVEQARSIMASNQSVLLEIGKKAGRVYTYGKPYADNVRRLATEGAENVLVGLEDIHKAWHLVGSGEKTWERHSGAYPHGVQMDNCQVCTAVLVK